MTEIVNPSKASEVLVCERRVYLRAKFGDLETREASKRMERGTAIHKVAETESDKRCFIATCIYGQESYEVERLRSFRDEVLLKSRMGRVFVLVYYAISPYIVTVLGRNTILRAKAKTALDEVVRRIE